MPECYKVDMASNAITVLVADDHPLFRDGIVRAIRDRPTLELLGEAADGRDALARIAELDARRRGARSEAAGARRTTDPEGAESRWGCVPGA